MVRRSISISGARFYGERSECIQKARVITPGFLVLNNDASILIPKMSHVQPALKSTALSYPMVRRRLDSGVLIGGHQNYYHNLIDYMINFLCLDKERRSWPTVVIKPSSRFHFEIIEAFGISNPVEMSDWETLKVKSLSIPSKAIIREGIVGDGSAIDLIRAWTHRRSAQTDVRRRIFISRRQAVKRRAENEEVATSIAEGFGFESVLLENMSFLEQVQLFYSCEAVIGLHGAGLANIIFCRPGCAVIELSPSGHTITPNYFRNLCEGLKHQHLKVPVEGDFNSSELKIDIAVLQVTLDRHFIKA